MLYNLLYKQPSVEIRYEFRQAQNVEKKLNYMVLYYKLINFIFSKKFIPKLLI
jgi:hypothetical protein